MKNYKKTIYLILILTITFVFSSINNVLAASASISTSSQSATVGDNVTITVNVNAATWNLKISGSGISDSIVGYDPDGNNTSTSKSYTLSTSSAGTYTVSLTGDVTDGATEETSDVNTSVSITIKEKEVTPISPEITPNINPTPSTDPAPNNSKSTDAYLTNLGFKKYDFSGFRKAKNEFYATVPNSVDSLEVYYSKSNPNSSVSISGNKNLVEGTNVIKVTVTAEAGNTNVYKIYVTKKTAEDIENTTPNIIDETEQNDLFLTALSIGNLELSPTFDKSVLEYTATLNEDLKEIEVLASANSKDAQINIEGNKDLVEGENIITITVSNEKNTVTYKITLTKKTNSINGALLTTVLNNNISEPPFIESVLSYLTSNSKEKIASVICLILLACLGSYALVEEMTLLKNTEKVVSTNKSTKYVGNRFK